MSFQHAIKSITPDDESHSRINDYDKFVMMMIMRSMTMVIIMIEKF